MEGKRIVVVGGVAGGMSFATRYRRLNQDASIIILDKGPYVSFANCGLPYFISGEISDRDALLVASKSMLEQRFQLDVRVNHEVVAIHPEAKTVEVLVGGNYETIAYDTLVLSPGASPLRLDIEGMNSRSGIHTLRNIPDLDRIMADLEKQPQSALVIGAGFIGLEVAENLKHRGLNVTVVEKAPQVLPPFDVEMAQLADDTLKRHGVAVYTNTSVKRFEGDIAYLEDDTPIQAQLVIMAVGVLPETKIAQEAGLELGMRGGLVVNEQFQTSNPSIYAVGDAIIVKQVLTGEDSLIPLASPANRQGRQLADILSGMDVNYKGSLGTAIVRIFDKTFASTGLNERQLKGRDYKVIHLNANNHAGYYPGASPISLKVIFDPSDLSILGAQGVGEQGVDKRIDVLATAIKAKMNIIDLQELELTYAPPYGSAKDIVNMVGYVAQNIATGHTHTVQWHALEALQAEGSLLLDVRTDEERQAGYIQGSIHMPLDTLRCTMGQLPRDKHIIVYCQSAVRSYNAEQILKHAGFNVSNLDGSYLLYSSIKPERIVRN